MSNLLTQITKSPYGTSVADRIAPEGHNAFTSCVPRSTKQFVNTAPRKRGPKTVNARVISALRTDEERAHIRMAAAARRVNPETNWVTPSSESMHRKEIRIELARAA